MGNVRSLNGDSGRDASGAMGISDLAEVLFASPLQESENPSPLQVRAAVEETLQACGGDCAACAACVAQEAGDHPEQYVRRMRWALRTIESSYPHDTLLAA
jgi:hypothetical protein